MKDEKEFNIKTGYYSIDEIIKMNGIRQRHFVNKLKEEEQKEVTETEDHIKADIEAHRKTTELNKKRFINEIKGDLGKDLKKDPSKVKVIKKPWYVRLSNAINKFLTKF